MSYILSHMQSEIFPFIHVHLCRIYISVYRSQETRSGSRTEGERILKGGTRETNAILKEKEE